MNDGFAQEWSAAEGRVRAFVQSRLREPSVVDDVMQETALRAFRGYSSFRRRSSFLTWVVRIARNEVSRALGSRDRAGPLGSDVDPPARPEEPPPAPVGIGAAAAAAVGAGYITARQAEVLAARLGAPDETWEAIGQRVGLSGGNCAVAHFRGVQGLRAYLFAARPADLGGPAAVSAAFAAACSRATNPLTPAESGVFRAAVIDRSLDPLRRGLFATFRDACTKVILELDHS